MVPVPLMFLPEFPSASLPCRGKKNLMIARVSMLSKSRASPDMLPFSLCNKERLAIRHMNRPLFPKTQSIPFYDIGKYGGLRTYQHPLVQDNTRRGKKDNRIQTTIVQSQLRSQNNHKIPSLKTHILHKRLHFTVEALDNMFHTFGESKELEIVRS